MRFKIIFLGFKFMLYVLHLEKEINLWELVLITMVK